MLGTGRARPPLLSLPALARRGGCGANARQKGARGPRHRARGSRGKLVARLGLTPPPERRLSRAEGATSGAPARAAPPARPSSLSTPPSLCTSTIAPWLHPGHAPSRTSRPLLSLQAPGGAQGVVATLAPATASEQSVRGSPAKACGEAECRRAGTPQQDAEPSTASAPTGCWSCRAGASASPGNWTGRWDRGGRGPGGFLTLCAPRADPHSRFLCSASSRLRGSSFPVAAARCRCTRIPRTRSALCCLVSRWPRTTPRVPRAGWVEHARLGRAALPRVPKSWR